MKLTLDLKALEKRAGEIASEALREHDYNASAALAEVAFWMAQVEAQRAKAQSATSAGFLRRNTSHLKWQPDAPIVPVDDDSWIETGRESA
jgi:hypothetical protein